MSNTNRKLINGVGVNDADYSVKPRGEPSCPFYMRWKNMMDRCYSQSYQKRYPSYVKARVCDEWKSFMAFREWMSHQDWIGKQLDKDILVSGNKVYGPETCAFVTRELNMFLNNSRKNRYKTTQSKGVHLSNSGSFVASIRVNGEACYIGSFDCEEKARFAYLNEKIKELSRFIEIEQDSRVKKALIKMRDQYTSAF